MGARNQESAFFVGGCPDLHGASSPPQDRLECDEKVSPTLLETVRAMFAYKTTEPLQRPPPTEKFETRRSILGFATLFSAAPIAVSDPPAQPA
ncbi:hypothetical protein CCHR01_13053 [Colletotrichum chrysophilum]|uniref:Uncharacterized protein n=1 Tax=Colletotrichum chrysophilum TaxID=1836956 RepID=A0AAD9EDJ5_9PEZI|nr:hypothetical protein CCHR01_13053 [Colletotrichum chrysophilum]